MSVQTLLSVSKQSSGNCSKGWERMGNWEYMANMFSYSSNIRKFTEMDHFHHESCGKPGQETIATRVFAWPSSFLLFVQNKSFILFFKRLFLFISKAESVPRLCQRVRERERKRENLPLTHSPR